VHSAASAADEIGLDLAADHLITFGDVLALGGEPMNAGSVPRKAAPAGKAT
jgi:hypothetical protein